MCDYFGAAVFVRIFLGVYACMYKIGCMCFYISVWLCTRDCLVNVCIYNYLVCLSLGERLCSYVCMCVLAFVCVYVCFHVRVFVRYVRT